ncbi:MAG: hypothetical protein AAF982_01995 [Pseudomonadota bacterium]
MADLPPKPIFTRTISFGNLVQIVLIVVGLAGSWAVMKSDISRIDAAAADAKTIRIAIEARVRVLENQAARSDERYTNLLSNIQAIRDAIARLESR